MSREDPLPEKASSCTQRKVEERQKRKKLVDCIGREKSPKGHPERQGEERRV